MDDTTTVDGAFMFAFVDPDLYDDDPVGRELQEVSLGVFRATPHGTYVLDHFYDADALSEALNLRE